MVLGTYGRSLRRPTVGFFSDLPWVVKGALKEVTFPPVERLKIPRPKLPGPIRIRFGRETYTVWRRSILRIFAHLILGRWTGCVKGRGTGIIPPFADG